MTVMFHSDDLRYASRFSEKKEVITEDNKIIGNYNKVKPSWPNPFAQGEIQKRVVEIVEKTLSEIKENLTLSKIKENLTLCYYIIHDQDHNVLELLELLKFAETFVSENLNLCKVVEYLAEIPPSKLDKIYESAQKIKYFERSNKESKLQIMEALNKVDLLKLDYFVQFVNDKFVKSIHEILSDDLAQIIRTLAEIPLTKKSNEYLNSLLQQAQITGINIGHYSGWCSYDKDDFHDVKFYPGFGMSLDEIGLAKLMRGLEESRRSSRSGTANDVSYYVVFSNRTRKLVDFKTDFINSNRELTLTKGIEPPKSKLSINDKMNEAFYAIFGLTSEASIEDVRDAYHAFILNNHPDKTVNLDEDERSIRTQLFIKAQEAYDRLKPPS